MQNFIYKLIQYCLNLQTMFLQKRQQRFVSSFNAGCTKISFHGANELILSSETEIKKAELEVKVKKIIKSKLNNPEKLLNFIQDEGTDVFRLKYANILLNFIGEEEGFITPLKGINALILNLYVNYMQYKKIVFSLKSNEMFVLRPLTVDIYYMIHQFHKWYSYKLGLPGFEHKEQQNFKKIFKTLKNEDITNLSLGEIISLKEAIARDTEAIDFVINYAKENETSTKLLKKIKAGKSIKV